MRLEGVEILPVTVCSEEACLTFFYKEQWVHSRRNPFLEVERRYGGIEPKNYNSFFCISSDFLYGLEFFCKKGLNKGTYIFLIYLDFSMLKTLFEYRDLEFLAPYKDRLFFQVSNDVSSIENFVYRDLKRTLVIENATMNHLYGEILKKIKDDYYENIELEYSSMLTRFYFEKVWVKNILENILVKRKIYSLLDLKDIFLSQKVILLGAGVSLYDCLPDLREKQNEYIIVACDSALPILLASGIRADFITSQDAGYYNYLDFLRKGSGDYPAPLLVDLIAYPKIIREYPHDVFIYRSHNEGEEKGMVSVFAKELGIDGVIPSIETSSTIIHTSINLLKYMGAEEIILMGVDMGYAFFHTHCVGAIPFYFFYSQAFRLNPLSSQEFKASHPEKGAWAEGFKDPIYMTRQSNIHFAALKEIALKIGKIFLYKSFMRKDEYFYSRQIKFIIKNEKRLNRIKTKELNFEIEKFQIEMKYLVQKLGEVTTMIERGESFSKQEYIEEIKKTPFLSYIFTYTEYALSRSSLDETMKLYSLFREMFNYLHILLERIEVNQANSIEKSFNP